MRHRPVDDEDGFDDEEGDGFISGTPAKPRPMRASDVVGGVKRSLSSPMVIAGIVIVFLLYWRPWGGSAASVQGLAIIPDPGASTYARNSASDGDVVVVDTTARSSVGAVDDDDSDDDDGKKPSSSKLVTKVTTSSSGRATGADDDVVVVDSKAAQAVSVGGGESSASAATTTLVTSTSGDMTTVLHVTDDIGTPPPSPPPKSRRTPTDPKKLETELRNLEKAMKQRTAPSGEQLAMMLATVERLMHEARADDVTFEQRSRLAEVEKTIQKAKKGTVLAQKLAEGESLLRAGVASDELRNKLKEIERAIQEAGPQVDNHPHIKEQLEKQLNEIDKRLEERKAADERRRREDHERAESERRRNEAMMRDRQRAEEAARRQEDIRGAPPGGKPPDEVQQLRERLERMQREGGDNVVIAALRDKLTFLTAQRDAAWAKDAAWTSKGGPGVPLPGGKLPAMSSDYTTEDDGSDPDEVVLGRRKKKKARIRGIFRGGASAGAKTDDEVENYFPTRRGKKVEDDDDEEEEVIVVKRVAKKGPKR